MSQDLIDEAKRFGPLRGCAPPLAFPGVQVDAKNTRPSLHANGTPDEPRGFLAERTAGRGFGHDITLGGS